MASSLVSFTTVSNNAVSNKKATTGNIITLRAEFDAPATVITGSINSKAVTYSQVGSTSVYTATYTVLETDLQGEVTVELDADTVSEIETSDESPVIIDTIRPAATVSYSTSGTSLLKPKVGDVHTMIITVGEELYNYPRINFSPVSTTRLDNKITSIHPTYKVTQLDPLTWSATYTIRGNEILPKTILINLTDLAGNINVFTHQVIEAPFLDFSNSYYYFDHFINQTKGRYYTQGTGASNAIVPPIATDECGILQMNVQQSFSFAGYNISSNFDTFLYQSYNLFEAKLKISDLSTFSTEEDSVIRFGFLDSTDAEPVYGIYFESDTANNRWMMCTALNGVRTKNSIQSPINVLKDVSIWSKELKIKYIGTAAQFFIDGYLLDTQAYVVPDPISTEIFPSLGVVLKKTSGDSDPHFLTVDYLELIMKKNLQGDYNEDFNEDYYI